MRILNLLFTVHMYMYIHMNQLNNYLIVSKIVYIHTFKGKDVVTYVSSKLNLGLKRKTT